jgi:integrator complex subunit 1
MSTRERFLYAICDLIPMIILASAQAFNSLNNTTNPNVTTTRSLPTMNNDQWLLFIQRISYIQCSSCLFFLYTLPRLFDSTSTINPMSYVTCLYSILFTAQVNSYLRIENWPPEEPIGLRNDLFRLSSEIPLLGETLYLLIQIGLTSQFRINPSIIVDLIDLIVRRSLNVEQKISNDYVSIYLHLPENRCEIFLKKFFDLTRYHIPIQIQFPSTYQIPANLSITDIFWKTCLICLLLASHDPQIFGRFIWLSIPQIRLFMEMLLTGDYTYPPKSMIETKNFLDKFYMNELVQLREEKDLILELEKYLASPKIINEKNSQLLGKIIVLDLQQIKRPSSHDKNEKNMYNLIQGFNNTYKLSSMLCRCRSPDFILDILNRKEQQGKNILDSQTSWLTSLIDSNIDCLNVFPIICLCDYFQHMIIIYNNKYVKTIPTKKTLHALETILTRFKTIIHSVKQQILSNTQVRDFILKIKFWTDEREVKSLNS